MTTVPAAGAASLAVTVGSVPSATAAAVAFLAASFAFFASAFRASSAALLSFSYLRSHDTQRPQKRRRVWGG